MAATGPEMNRNSRGSVWVSSCRQPSARTKAPLEAGNRREGGPRRTLERLVPHTASARQSSGAGQSHEERRKPPYPCSVLDLVDPQLHGHVKAVQDVSAKYQGVYRGVDCMDPTWGGEATGRVSRGSWTTGRVMDESTQKGPGDPGEHPGPELRMPGLPDAEGKVPDWPTGLRHTAPDGLLQPLTLGWLEPVVGSWRPSTKASSCCYRPGRSSSRSRPCPPPELAREPDISQSPAHPSLSLVPCIPEATRLRRSHKGLLGATTKE